MGISTEYFESGNLRQDRQSIIFLEGIDDVYFISALLSDIGADSSRVGLLTVDGVANFVPRLLAYFKSSNFTQGVNRSLSVICDADGDPEGIERRIKVALGEAKLPLPPVGGHDADADHKVGMFLFPGVNEEGDLEKLCLNTVAGTKREVMSEQFIAEAYEVAKSENKNMNGSRYKRKVQAYLATWPEGLSRGAGMGFKNKCFVHDSVLLSPLKEFLKGCIA